MEEKEIAVKTPSKLLVLFIFMLFCYEFIKEIQLQRKNLIPYYRDTKAHLLVNTCKYYKTKKFFLKNVSFVMKILKCLQICRKYFETYSHKQKQPPEVF